MKNIFRNIAIASVIATGLAVTSCEDMMTVDTGDKAYQNAQDTLYSYLGIMRAMQDVAERQVILGEIRGDLVSSSDYTTDTLFAISNFDNPQDKSCSMLNVSDYYNVINNCNFYIHHADTSAIKSNVQYMIPEYAQVKAVRAWAYLQLVKNYRAVPYITEPISNLGMIESFDYSANLVTKDDLIDRIIADGLAQYVDTPYPQYGNPSDAANHRWGIWETGASGVNISARLCFIPIRVILGDLFLLRGAAGDYEKAARYYYDYLRNETTPMASQLVEVSASGNRISRLRNPNAWGEWGRAYTYNATTNEVISLIPSSANAGFGKMLTRVADIFGYAPSSRQISSDQSSGEDANGDAIFEPTGSITVSASYKRQYGPSNAYQDIVNQQTYITVAQIGTTHTASYPAKTDARYYYATESTTDDDGESYRLCCKAAQGSTFFYTIPTYRKSLIWLRLAEAINRSGYPEFAFAILKDGLNQYTLPKVEHPTYIAETIEGTEYDDKYYTKINKQTGEVVYVGISTEKNKEGQPDTKQLFYYDENGVFSPYTGTVAGADWKWNMTTGGIVHDVSHYSPIYYVKDTLKVQNFTKFLDFNSNVWNSTYGIHAKGAGATVSGTNAEFTMTVITGTIDGGAYGYDEMLQKQGVDPATANKNDIINAVENIIVDELALETAFEGNRFTDLVRIAEHKNASGYDGTEWLAQKIANRGSKAAVETSPAVDAFDGALYSKLKNPGNWYFELPAWTTK